MAITPAAGFVASGPALLIGLTGGVICFAVSVERLARMSRIRLWIFLPKATSSRVISVARPMVKASPGWSLEIGTFRAWYNFFWKYSTSAIWSRA